MLDAQELKLTTERLSALESPLQMVLDLRPDPTSKFARALDEVAHEIAAAAGSMITLVPATGPEEPYPSLRVKNVKYLAVPHHRELEPFLDLLLFMSNGVGLRPEPPLEAAHLELLMAPTCPNCPLVVRTCGEVAAAAPEVEVTVIDVQFFSELAGSCRSVPTLIIDGAYTVVGALSARRLVELLKTRGGPRYLEDALSSMLEAGRLAEIGPLLQSEAGHAALAVIMGQGTMQQKMGMMLAVEQLLEHQPHGLDAAVPELLPLLESEVPTLRGDAADLLGRIGAPGAHAGLSRLLEDDNPDVREVAEEALGMLRSPS